ncbi:MAG: nucleoside 2-deoxyribosyltransferase domain-containing protein [bacterium]
MNKDRIIIPPEKREVEGPMIFLAGPIKGSERWQEVAMEYIHEIDPNIYLASPRRVLDRQKDFTQEMYNEQVDWETEYLNRCAREGAIIFWLASEKEHYCERPFAQTTRFELAEWKVKHENTGANLVIGIEDGFTNHRYIKRRFSQDCPEVPFFTDLKSTCLKAVELAKQK